MLPSMKTYGTDVILFNTQFWLSMKLSLPIYVNMTTIVDILTCSAEWIQHMIFLKQEKFIFR